MRTISFVRLGVLGLLVVGYAGTALAAPKSSGHEKSLGNFGAWHTYTYEEGGQTVCYMVTTKTLKSTGPKNRGTPYLMITHRPIEASTDVLSYGAGTLVSSKPGVWLTIGSQKFNLFSVRDTAWARDALTDHKIAHAFQNATMAQVTATASKKGTASTLDRFDLTGAALAAHAIGKACGLSEDIPKKTTASAQKKH